MTSGLVLSRGDDSLADAEAAADRRTSCSPRLTDIIPADDDRGIRLVAPRPRRDP